MDKAKLLISKFQKLFSEIFNDYQIKTLDDFSPKNFEIKKNNIFIGNITQIINLFVSKILNPLEIRSLFFDDLDHALSLGNQGNIVRFLNYLKHQNTNILESAFLQINVNDDEAQNMIKIKEIIALKFTNIRILPEESEEEVEGESYQMTKKQSKQLMKQKSAAGLLEEMLHQYYYKNKQINMYSMIYLLIKFEIFSKKTLIITPDLNEAYR